MKVHELIERLQRLPGDLPVVCEYWDEGDYEERSSSFLREDVHGVKEDDGTVVLQASL